MRLVSGSDGLSLRNLLTKIHSFIARTGIQSTVQLLTPFTIFAGTEFIGWRSIGTLV